MTLVSETTSSLQAVAATILNVTEDHMDRYPFGLQQYRAAKLRIYEYTVGRASGSYAARSSRTANTSGKFNSIQSASAATFSLTCSPSGVSIRVGRSAGHAAGGET